MYRLWLGRVGVGMGAAMTALVLILPWLLETWLGDRIPEESLAVGQVLCVGVFLNSIGAVNFAYLHAHGKTRVTAIAHLVELPVFFLALYWGISQFGIVGAAYAWVIRVAVDVAFLSILVAFQHRSSPKQLSGDHE
jgi:O-antigen/teichoic acid export membrane protein